MMKKLFALLLALAMLLSVSAVFAETPVELTSPEPTATPVPDTLLATLNGREIRENDEMLQYYYTNLMNQVTDPDGETDQAIARMLAMRYLMQALIVNSKASEVYTETDYEAFRAQAQQEWNDVLNSFMADLGITETSTEEERPPPGRTPSATWKPKWATPRKNTLRNPLTPSFTTPTSKK